MLRAIINPRWWHEAPCKDLSFDERLLKWDECVEKMRAKADGPFEREQVLYAVDVALGHLRELLSRTPDDHLDLLHGDFHNFCCA